MACVNHPDRESVATCVTCGDEICEEDRVMVGGKSYCKMHAQAAMQGNDPVNTGAPASDMSAPSASAAKTSSTGLDSNIAGLLCYLVGWLSGLVFVLIEKEDKVVKFHAYQSLIFFGGVSVIQIGLNIIGVILGMAGAGLIVLTGIAGGLLGLATLVFWIMGMVKAFQGEMYKFPIVGDMAEKYSQQ